MAVKWTTTSLRNIAKIAEYIESDNPVRARSFVLELGAKASSIAEHPGIGRPGRVMGTRELVAHKNYIIVYRIKGQDVEIIRVQHVAKRWPMVFD